MHDVGWVSLAAELAYRLGHGGNILELFGAGVTPTDVARTFSEPIVKRAVDLARGTPGATLETLLAVLVVDRELN